jgi:NADH-quinone oxidoreductase subunit J
MSRKPVAQRALLIRPSFRAAGLFVLLSAEFLAMLLVVVYVGAVAVLFLFVVMMLDVDFAQLREGLRQIPAAGRHHRGVLAIEMIVVSAAVASRGRGREARAVPAPAADATNAEVIGRVLYTDYVLLFQAAGMVLLVSMIGAIVLTLRHRAGVRRQSIAGQVGRKRADAVSIVTGVKSGSGRRSGSACRMNVVWKAIWRRAPSCSRSACSGVFVNRKNIIVILMSIELILLAVNINLVAFSAYLNNVEGQIFALLVLTVAAAEAAIGLAILVTFFRNRGDINVEAAGQLKG